MRVKNLRIREIFATNGRKTIEVELETSKATARSSVPVGTSIGRHEVFWLPVEEAIRKFLLIRRQFRTQTFENIEEVDNFLRILDKSADFREIGGNLALAISSAFLKAFALEEGKEVFEYLIKEKPKIPLPICNIVGGWKEQSDVQEFHFLPVHQESFLDSITKIVRAYEEVGKELKEKDPYFIFAKNIESAWVTYLHFKDTLKILTRIANENLFRIGLDLAASQLWDGSYYNYSRAGERLSRAEQVAFVEELAKRYPISYIEDPFHEDDFTSFSVLTHRLKPKLVCIPEGHSILTPLGLKDIVEVKVGDKVLSHDGKFHEVEQVFSRFYEGYLIEIIPHIIRFPIKVTPDHPILIFRLPKYGGFQTRKKLKEQNLKAVWLNAKEVKVGDYAVFPKLTEYNNNFIGINIPVSKFNSPKSIPKLLPFSAELVELCGYYVAEGSSGGKNVLQFSLGLNERKLSRRICKLIDSIFGLDASIYEEPEKSRLFVRINSCILWKWFRDMFGSSAGEKRIPYWIMSLPNSLLLAFVRALWVGDGYESQVSYSTVSKNLALQLPLLLSKIGIVASVGEFLQPAGAFGKSIYRVDISEKYSQLFSNLIGLNPKRVGNKMRNFFVYDNYIYLKIKSVRRIPFKGKVYNLKVKDTNSYMCEGIVTHNCGDDIIATNLKRLKQAISQKSINAVIIKPNQVGSITDTIKFVEEAKKNGIVTIMSHRSGETEDTLICHLAVGLGCDYIKLGISGERTVKINEMIRIEEKLK